MGYDCIICEENLEDEAGNPKNTNESDDDVPVVVAPSSKRSRHDCKIDEVAAANCGHLFHKVCIIDWLNKQKKGSSSARICPYLDCNVISRVDDLRTIQLDPNNEVDTAHEIVIKNLERQLKELQGKSGGSNMGRQLKSKSSSILDLNGNYELLCSRNFKHYLAALDIKTDTNFVRPNKIPIQTVARKSTGGCSPYGYGSRWNESSAWGREIATIKFDRDLEHTAAYIKTGYYYDDKIHKTNMSFIVGDTFYAQFEGVDKESNQQGDDLGEAKTLITMESPCVMKQVQTYKTKGNKRLSVTITREFTCTGLMKVTMDNPNSFKTAVRIYEKIQPGQRSLKEQTSCREVSSDDDSDLDNEEDQQDSSSN